MSHLSKWLNTHRIQFVESVSDWKEAIEIAGKPLIKDGAISQNYIDAIIRQKEAIGPYFVIAPGIAMPHARPEEGALSLGLSIVKIKHAVKFGSEDNDPVTIVLMFSAPDSNSHIEMISQMAEVLSDEEMMGRIFNVSNAQELHNILMGSPAAQ